MNNTHEKDPRLSMSSTQPNWLSSTSQGDDNSYRTALREMEKNGLARDVNVTSKYASSDFDVYGNEESADSEYVGV